MNTGTGRAARLLHVADRWTERGGAARYLRAVAAAQAHGLGGARYEPLLAVGACDRAAATPPCGLAIVPGLDTRPNARGPDPRPGLEALVRRWRPTLVHLHASVDPLVLEWAAGQPALVSVQDHRYFCPGRGKWHAQGHVCHDTLSAELCRACFDDAQYFERLLELTRRRLAALDRLHVSVLSHYMRGELLAAGLRPERVHVAVPFVSGLDPQAVADGAPCVLFAGRLVAAKGVEDALWAWRAAGTGLPLVCAGTGPWRTALEARGVEVLGWLDDRRLSSTYRRAAALLLPSRWQEPFGLVGLEAASLGVPVAAWDSGGVREWHTGEGLVAWGDREALAAALRAALGTRGRARPGFDAPTALAQLSQAYSAAGLG